MLTVQPCVVTRAGDGAQNFKHAGKQFTNLDSSLSLFTKDCPSKAYVVGFVLHETLCLKKRWGWERLDGKGEHWRPQFWVSAASNLWRALVEPSSWAFRSQTSLFRPAPQPSFAFPPSPQTSNRKGLASSACCSNKSQLRCGPPHSCTMINRNVGS